jgi:hypothetical protein
MRYVAIRSEGGLIPYDLLDKIASEDAAGQKPGDFGLPKGRRLTDEISRVWADAQSLWSNFKRRRESLGDRDPYGTSITRSWIVSLLGDVDMLGFDLKLQASAVVVNNSTYAISHRSGEGEDAIPVHIEGLKIDLDRRLHTKLRTSPQAMVQDFLNNGEQVLWGIVTNGLSLRILRDSSRTARPTYLEFDLESILEGNRFNEFALLYRVCHRSRFPRAGQDPADCLLERYYQDSVEQGLRVRDKLREGVEETLKILGTAFLQHPANDVLRGKVSGGQLTAIQFHRQLLLLVYRLLFLMVAEERGLIVSVGDNAEPNQKVYDDWYSITRLRDRAAQIIDTSPFGDVWQGLQQTFSLFEYGLDTNPLGIPPLNGDLFHQERAIPDLKGTELHNHDLLRAIRHLSLFKEGNVQQRVNYSALDVEELGSVYESLLDYQPVLNPTDKGLVFELRSGMERKSTGSYYTRPELVHELVESALVPVMEGRIAEAEKASDGKNLVEEQKAKIAAILNMTVCDPACGSGHFLLAASRRLGKELARIRTAEDEPKPEDFHLAVRDVISHCVYGVDLNPLAVDLCKLALWLEGHWAGKPLSFLDHRIRCGNSLVGLLDPEVLAEGIPDEAFTSVTGDDKKVAATFKKRNKQERTSKQRGLSFEPDDHSDEYAKAKRELTEITEDSAAAVRRKAELYGGWRAGMQHSHDEAVGDLWTAQFFHPFTRLDDPAICTTGPFLDFATGVAKQPQKVASAQALAMENRFFHWRLEFPEVFERGGFDVVLGNPPWERMKLQEEEHWADDSYIANARNKAERARRIADYRQSADLIRVSRIARFDAAKHASESEVKFARTGTRFPLAGSGDVNTYALFAELCISIVSLVGRAGLVLPVAIATDHSTQDFFGAITSKRQLVSLLGFENEAFIFPGVHNEFKFCALTLSGEGRPSPRSDLAFFCRHFEDISQPERHFQLSIEDFRLFNPQTQTCPIFRTGADARLTRKVYQSVPVLCEGNTDNRWGVSYLRMFDMANDSGLFRTRQDLESENARIAGNIFQGGSTRFRPLYEAKMAWQYDHRFASLIGKESAGARISRKFEGWYSVVPEDPNDLPMPQYWVSEDEVEGRLTNWTRDWLLGFRDITNATNERTCVFSVLPRTAVGHTLSLIFFDRRLEAKHVAAFLSNANALIFDYIVRQKIGGTHLTFSVVNQLPFLPPNTYNEEDFAFLIPRVVELVYTAHDMVGFARDLGIEREPYIWDGRRRSLLRAEIDAFFAHMYELTREELEYVLDPKSIYGPDFPSLTFRVLKMKEEKEYGEYVTQRLVLAAFDKLATSKRFVEARRTSAIEIPRTETIRA